MKQFYGRNRQAFFNMGLGTVTCLLSMRVVHKQVLLFFLAGKALNGERASVLNLQMQIRDLQGKVEALKADSVRVQSYICSEEWALPAAKRIGTCFPRRRCGLECPRTLFRLCVASL